MQTTREVNKNIDRPVSCDVEHKGQEKTWSLTGKFEMKGTLQAM